MTSARCVVVRDMDGERLHLVPLGRPVIEDGRVVEKLHVPDRSSRVSPNDVVEIVRVVRDTNPGRANRGVRFVEVRVVGRYTRHEWRDCGGFDRWCRREGCDARMRRHGRPIWPAKDCAGTDWSEVTA